MLELEEPKEADKERMVFDKKAKLLVEKQRNGPRSFTIPLWFEGRRTRFHNYTGQDSYAR